MNRDVILAVTNDLSGDQRVHKVALSLMKFGWNPVLVGRRLKESGNLTRPYPVVRFNLPIRKGPLFYLFYNIRLFFHLLFSRAGTLVANDLDTLPAVFYAGKLRGKRIIYDSHEYFTEVPELVGRPLTRRIWLVIERAIFPRLGKVYTVNDTIARIYSETYKVRVRVVRNVPMAPVREPEEGYLPDLLKDKKRLIYQGALNIGRGLEEMVAAMALLPECGLILAGDGDIRKSLEDQVKAAGLDDRVHFTGRVPLENLAWYTRQAMIGLSLEQDLGLNYRYALPNKLFDYLHAGLPVLASDLPEIRAVMEASGAGILVSRFDPESLANSVRFMLADEERLRQWGRNATGAASGYAWEKEEQVLQEIFG